MNFIKAFAFLSLFTGHAFASTVSVIGPCDSQPIFTSHAMPHDPTVTLGDFTVKTLANAGIPFKGSRTGILAIANSPTGDAALEVLSDTAMRSYGWCVSVDGNQPRQMPDKVILTNVNSRIIWFYGYMSYVAGEWKEGCNPSYLLKSPYICKNRAF